MSPQADDAAFAQRFLDDLIDRVRDVPSMKADIEHLKANDRRWNDMHTKVIEGTVWGKVLRYAGTAIQGVIAVALIPTLALLVDLRDSRISGARDVIELRHAIADQTFAPPDWGRMQQTVSELVDANQRTLEAVNMLSGRVNELSKTVSKVKQTKVEVHPTSTIIMQKPDQSRANKPFGEPGIPHGGPR